MRCRLAPRAAAGAVGTPCRAPPAALAGAAVAPAGSFALVAGRGVGNHTAAAPPIPTGDQTVSERDRLDAQYNLRARHPDHPAFFARYAEWSARTRRDLACETGLAYGPSAAEAVDVFPARAPGAPLHVFIHGGYWQSRDRSEFSFVAAGLAPAGVAVAVGGYALAPAVDMGEIVRQNRAAVAWLYRNAARFNADPGRIFVSGHSAGGHLAAMLMATDWPAFGDLPEGVVKGGCAISGVFDLEPVRKCYLNEALKLDEEAARRNSPLHRPPAPGTRLALAVGGDETDAFLDQSRTFAAACASRGVDVTHMVIPDLNHFEIIELLGRPESVLVAAIRAQMGLDGAAS